MPDPGAPGPAPAPGPGCGWAIVGCGTVAQAVVVPALRTATAAHAVTVWDRDPAAAAALHRDLPGAWVAADLAGCVGDPGVHAVYVATPADAHRAPVEVAAAAKKAVLVESPLTVGVADAAAIAAACDGLVAGTAFADRWHPAHLALSEVIDSGDVGTVTAVRLLGGEVAHAVDLVGMLLGDDLVRLEARGGSGGRGGSVRESVRLTGVTRRGVTVLIHGSPDASHAHRSRVEVHGTGGHLAAVDTLGGAAGGTLALTRGEGLDEHLAFDEELSPASAQLQRFSLAAVGASPWGYHLLRDVRLQRLLLEALA